MIMIKNLNMPHSDARRDMEALLKEKGKIVYNSPSLQIPDVYSIIDPPIAILREFREKYGRLDMSYHMYVAIGREEDIMMFEQELIKRSQKTNSKIETFNPKK